MDYYNVVSSDSYVSRLIDGLVLLVLGVSIGVVLSQALFIVKVDSAQVALGTGFEQQDSSTERLYGVDVPKGHTLEEN